MRGSVNIKVLSDSAFPLCGLRGEQMCLRVYCTLQQMLFPGIFPSLYHFWFMFPFFLFPKFVCCFLHWLWALDFPCWRSKSLALSFLILWKRMLYLCFFLDALTSLPLCVVCLYNDIPSLVLCITHTHAFPALTCQNICCSLVEVTTWHLLLYLQ